ncbi:MAG: 2-oxoacid:acceptor oxidoreductase family protein [Candidatus Moranbacteria bacterium]|nr:2-oxoacid:acceptor oxidoreductase family protein [Candidatus Moranbacteria bacterium]
MKKILEIIIYGRGGQGAKTTAEIIAQGALLENKYVQAFPEFGPERSGAPVQTFVRIFDKSIKTREPIFNPDCFMVLDETLLEIFDGFQDLDKNSFLIINTRKTKAEILKEIKFKGKLIIVDASGLSMKVIGENRPNTVILGKFAAVTKMVKLENLIKVFRNKYQEKLGMEKANKNINAIRVAYEEK